jgi:hypothetical protein
MILSDRVIRAALVMPVFGALHHHFRYASTMTQAARISVLEQIVEPVVRSLNVDAARALLRIRANKPAVKCMAILARKCDQGELTPEERAEYETNVLAGELLALLQAKARMILVRGNGNQ